MSNVEHLIYTGLSLTSPSLNIHPICTLSELCVLGTVLDILQRMKQIQYCLQGVYTQIISYQPERIIRKDNLDEVIFELKPEGTEGARCRNHERVFPRRISWCDPEAFKLLNGVSGTGRVGERRLGLMAERGSVYVRPCIPSQGVCILFKVNEKPLKRFLEHNMTPSTLLKHEYGNSKGNGFQVSKNGSTENRQEDTAGVARRGDGDLGGCCGGRNYARKQTL